MSAPKMFAHHWIGGEWVDSDKRRESINPATGETIGTYTEAGEAEATRAIAAALKAFRETDWRKNRPLRAKVLNYMADRFEARADDLIEILTLENGKVKPEAQFELSMVPSRLGSMPRWPSRISGAQWRPRRDAMRPRCARRQASPASLRRGTRRSCCSSDRWRQRLRRAAPPSASSPGLPRRRTRGCVRS